MDALHDGAEPSGLPPADAALARAIARTAERRAGDIDAILANLLAKPLPKRAGRVRAVLAAGAAQLLFMRQADHAVVSLSAELLKADAKTGGFVGLANAVLRRLTREREALLAALPAGANTPDWLYARWVSTYGEAAAAAIEDAHRAEPPLDLCLAPGATVPPGATPLPGGGARLPATDVTALAGFEAGAFWVQDFAAQRPANLLPAGPGRRVLDLCAAPGGKTMQLAATGAEVTAVEVDPARAALIADNLARTNLADRVSVVVGDARSVTGTFDAVLLDAPCSATGTVRRHPDVARRKTLPDIKALAALQRELLVSAAERVAPGGTLVFATCSMEPEEGEAHVPFAEGLDGFSPDPIDPGDPAAGPFASGHTVRLLPHHTVPGTTLCGMDGFFAMRLRRTA